MRLKKIIKPERLNVGDTIGIISPASPIFKEKLKKGIYYLENLGFNVKLGRHVYGERGYLAGTDEERASDLHELFYDNSVKAVFCSRGGYGSIRILKYIDFELIKKNPKIFVGFSDLTALEISIFAKNGLVTFYGPTIAEDFDNEIDYSGFDLLLKIISSETNSYKVDISDYNVVKGGKSTGFLIGGCLSVFSSLLGTEYLPDLKDAVIFLEDTDEEPYRIDRYLSQLRLCGIFNKARGLIFGKFTRCESKEKDYKGPYVDEIINDTASNLDIPVIKNLSFGHIKGKITIPVGIKASVNTDKMYLSFDENAVM